MKKLIYNTLGTKMRSFVTILLYMSFSCITRWSQMTTLYLYVTSSEVQLVRWLRNSAHPARGLSFLRFREHCPARVLSFLRFREHLESIFPSRGCVPFSRVCFLKFCIGEKESFFLNARISYTAYPLYNRKRKNNGIWGPPGRPPELERNDNCDMH